MSCSRAIWGNFRSGQADGASASLALCVCACVSSSLGVTILCRACTNCCCSFSAGGGFCTMWGLMICDFGGLCEKASSVFVASAAGTYNTRVSCRTQLVCWRTDWPQARLRGGRNLAFGGRKKAPRELIITGCLFVEFLVHGRRTIA